MERYILNDDGQPVECPDLLTWGRWFETATNRVVAKTDIDTDVRVSTVFLGLNHAFTHGDPVLWETMIFGGPENGWQDRYTSLADAKRGHEQAVERARAAGAVDPVVTR